MIELPRFCSKSFWNELERSQKGRLEFPSPAKEKRKVKKTAKLQHLINTSHDILFQKKGKGTRYINKAVPFVHKSQGRKYPLQIGRIFENAESSEICRMERAKRQFFFVFFSRPIRPKYKRKGKIAGNWEWGERKEEEKKRQCRVALLVFILAGGGLFGGDVFKKTATVFIRLTALGAY